MVTASRKLEALVVGAAAAVAIAWPLAAHAQEPARTDGWVVLALDDYRTLRARAFPAPPDPLAPPVDATLTRVDYDLRVNGETVTGEARLTVDVLTLGWVSIQVPAGMLVRGARLDGRPTALVSAKAGGPAGGTPPRVLISRAGRSVLALDVVIPVAVAGGLESMTLPPSTSAVSAISLTVPRTGVDLTVAGGFVAEQTESATDNRWTVYGSPGRPLTFSWKRKIDDRRSQLPLRTRARITELVALGEESSPITVSVRLEVVQGLAREIVLATPEGVTVNQVTGATVADWSHADGRLTVSFLEPVTAAAAIVVSAETRAPRDGAVAIPILRMPSAERETGGVAVDVIGAGEITDRQLRGFDPADPSDLGDIIEGRESPSMVAFGFTPQSGAAPRALGVNVSRYTPQAVLVANIEEARYDVLVAEDGKRLVRARYAVRNNQRGFLAVKLPGQSVLWSAVLGGRPVRPGLSPDGAYLLPLQKGRTGENAPAFAVELVYLQRSAPWTSRGDAAVELPAVDLPVSRTGVLVHHSPRFEVELKRGPFRPDADPGPWSEALRMSAGSAGGVGAGVAGGVPAPPPPAAPLVAPRAEGDARELQSLVERFRKDGGKVAVGSIPVQVSVPDFGPSFFAAAELTAELQAPVIELSYKRAAREE
jgi:hypothetical protein